MTDSPSASTPKTAVVGTCSKYVSASVRTKCPFQEFHSNRSALGCMVCSVDRWCVPALHGHDEMARPNDGALAVLRLRDHGQIADIVARIFACGIGSGA